MFRHCVIPAKAGIQTFISQCYAVIWIPTSAGMTGGYPSLMFTKSGFGNSLRPDGTHSYINTTTLYASTARIA